MVAENNPNAMVFHDRMLLRKSHKELQQFDAFEEALELQYNICWCELHCVRFGFPEESKPCLLRTMINGREYIMGYILKWTISPYQNAA